MIPVRLAVGDVVEQIDRAGQRAEDRERRKRNRDRGWLDQPSAEHDAREHEQVLGPLFRTQRRRAAAPDGRWRARTGPRSGPATSELRR